MKKILGVIGEKRAGKDTFCEHFRVFAQQCTRDRVSVYRYSDIIAKCLTILDLPTGRENMQKFSPLIESAYGKGVFSRAITRLALLDEAEIVIIQGVRWWTDFQELKKIGGELLYVTASKDNRFARAVIDHEKPDEFGMTREKFEEQELAETERYIPEIASCADFKLENNGSKEEFASVAKQFAARYLPGWEPK